ncbi:TonB-dependent receptor domain-containing protein [Pontimicrobium sp. MEBiC01747]
MKNQLLNFIVITLISSLSFSQNGKVTGTVTDNTQTNLPGVNVYIKNTTQGIQTDENGLFEITNVANGDNTLVISYLGFKTKEIPFTITSNETKNIGTIVVYEGNEILTEVVLVGERKNKFSRKKTAYVSKLPLKDLENSQVYSTVTSELLESQVVTNFDDALKNATGVDKRWEATGRSGDGTGYYSIRGFSAQPGLVDGVPGYTFSAIDPSYIERIEVLKGPSATLFGSTVTSLGGLINIVTKKPYEGFGGSVSYTGGSFNTHRVSADINTPLGNKDDLYFRLNASYLTQDSFQDEGFKKTFFVAPSLSYRVNNRLNLSVGIEYSKTKQTNPAMLFVRRGYPMPTNNVDDFGIDPSKSFTDNDVFLENPTFSTRAIADYKISDNWNSQTIIASSHTESKGYYQYLLEGAAVFFLNPNPQTQQEVDQNQFIQQFLQQDVLTRIIDKRDANAATFNIQQNFTGDFKIGNVRNRMVAGLDYVSKTTTNRNRAINPLTGLPVIYGFFLPDGTAVDDVFFTPTTVETEYPINQSILDPIFEQVPANDIKTRSQTYAAYVSDVINFSPTFSAMFGLRLDHFDQEGNKNIPEDDYNKTVFSPKFGLVYQPIKDKWSVFSNYQTGFINVDPQLATINGEVVVQAFDPQKARQFEFGTKTNLFNNRLSIGLSYYNIIVNDRNTLDPTSPLSSIIIDEITSKGFELEVNANPVSGLNIRGSLSINDSEITETQFASIAGTRPEEAGPKTIYNFWADYKFNDNTALKGFGIGVGFDGASKYYTMDNVVSGRFELPSYTIFNAALYYNHKDFRIGVKGNNLSNKQYYKGWSTINPQAKRSVLGTIMYKF